MRRSRMVAPVIVITAGIAMAAGCSGGALAAHPSGNSTASPQSTPNSSYPTIPTGTRLGEVLARAHLPTGWKHAPGAGSIRDTGLNYVPMLGAAATESACQWLDSTVEWPRCRRWRRTAGPLLNYDPTTTSVRTIPHLGGQNLFLTSSERTSNGGTLTGQMILVRDGIYIVGVDTSTGTEGTVRPATVQGFASWLVQLLDARLLA